MEEADSNTIILPAKKKETENSGPGQKFRDEKVEQIPEKDVEEISRRESLEALDKYKIREDAYSCMLSSQDIGQALTMKEKRRRDVQFSKAGLEVPEDDLNAKRNKVVDDHEVPFVQAADNSATIRPFLSRRDDGRKDPSSSSVPSQGPYHRIKSCHRGGSDPNNLIKGIGSEGTCKVMQPDTENTSFHHSLDNAEKAG